MIKTYCILLVVGVLLFLSRTYGFFIMCLKIAEKMHQILFDSILKASMIFFKMNSSGRIINRFSKDISVVDSAIPATLLDCWQVKRIYFIIIKSNIIWDFIAVLH